ncbi:AarF/ABC1/UbiB kinase family protein [Salipaludibacillus agaradhaerens]|uniref:AarF/ABC1/UbiB kinase family protein n=1 Tax=Salipaludibacillus agaradhaerens TaxID=76935 RepID=A0A9Q4G053_SALAG|nr:AarF/ABC1/UbiB kinase family protein [Salipaludibacillus agaradhaerens]MCR6097518.1 AarF/ABC1/UbiB kinase family protein [Salipaludibacillus agaradhaerens]MCR6112998.1 AarF/ABC1/UbiB kinase family protein [Salipaludibacillus agaradhaerens]
MGTTGRFKRMYKTIAFALTIFIRIYWYKIRKKTQSEWDYLWKDIGKDFRNLLFDLEGLLIKIGQLLSIRADLLPRPFIEQIQDLTDQVPPSSWQEIEKVLAEEWKNSVEDHVTHVETEAIASASIGEVYRATLKNGEKVAVKVQRPKIQEIVETDFRTLSIIIWFANHFVPLPKGFINLNVLFKELKQVIEQELDFSKEKQSLLTFKKRFEDYEGVLIPSVVEELSTSKVLVMEWVDGIKLTDEAALNHLNITKQELAKRLTELFLPQWLEPGSFHADPHTGNLLLSKEGKIILLDFGMIGTISKNDAMNFQRLIESLLSKNYSQAVEALIQLDFLLPDAEPRTMEKVLAEFMTFQPSQLQEMDIMSLKLEMTNMIQALPIQVPTRFVFLGRSFMTIEGILAMLIGEDEIIDEVKPVFLKWLRKQGNTKWHFVWYWLQSHPMFKIVHTVNDFLRLPERMEDLKELEQRRQFQFTMYENSKRHCFQVTLIGGIGGGIGFYTSESMLGYIGLGVGVLGLLSYGVMNYKLRKWLKYMHPKRKT